MRGAAQLRRRAGELQTLDDIKRLAEDVVKAAAEAQETAFCLDKGFVDGGKVVGGSAAKRAAWCLLRYRKGWI